VKNKVLPIDKQERLRRILERMESLVVAFSGGMDSSYLLKVAAATLPSRLIAVTADFSAVGRKEILAAKRIARSFGVRHAVVAVDPLGREPVVANDPMRCYHCKREIFSVLRRFAAMNRMHTVADGTTVDDARSYRPGLRALKELGIRSPLREAGMSKNDIALLSAQMGLTTAGKPSRPCLLTRFPYGERITPEKLKRVAAAEAFLAGLGFSALRVRVHGALARIEVLPGDTMRALDAARRQSIIRRFRKLGFDYVTLDIEGFRSGSMDEPLRRAARRQR